MLIYLLMEYIECVIGNNSQVFLIIIIIIIVILHVMAKSHSF